MYTVRFFKLSQLLKLQISICIFFFFFFKFKKFIYFHHFLFSACGCSMFGSVREDCEQMTGRCVCKSGIQGQKCTICNSVNKVLGPNGCVSPNTNLAPPTICSELVCYFDGICKEQNGIATCECNMECADIGEKQVNNNYFQNTFKCLELIF